MLYFCMFTPEQFDKLLHLTMLQLDGEEYTSMYEKMDTVLSYIDSLKDIEVDSHLLLNSKNILIKDRDYVAPTIDIKKNCDHSIAGNMIQIKFKRS